MLKRCYNPSETNICYIDCNVSDNFKNYTFFYDWYNSQIGSNMGFELDKDYYEAGKKRLKQHQSQLTIF